MSTRTKITFATGIVPFALTLLMAGCNKGAQTPGSTGGGSAAQIAAGEKVYQANGCSRCHALGGQGGGRAPDLSHEGTGPEHTAQWLADQVKNPKTHNPGSRMPAYEGKITEPDLEAIGVYLASLK